MYAVPLSRCDSFHGLKRESYEIPVQSQVSALSFYHVLPPCAPSFKSYSGEFAKRPGTPAPTLISGSDGRARVLSCNYIQKS